MGDSIGGNGKPWIERHALLWGSICFVVGTFPQWVSSVWSLRSSEPLLVVAARQPWGSLVPTFSPWFVTVPLGLLMFSALWWRRRTQLVDGQTKSSDVRVVDRLAVEVLDAHALAQDPIVRASRILDNVRLEWFRSDSGDLLVNATSGDVEPVHGFELWVVGMKRRGPSGVFADVSDFYQMPRVSIGKANLFHEQKERFTFLSHGHDAVRFQGNTANGSQSFAIRQPGVWKVQLSLAVAGIVRSRDLTFRWEEPAGLRSFADSGLAGATESSASNESAQLRVSRYAQWMDLADKFKANFDADSAAHIQGRAEDRVAATMHFGDLKFIDGNLSHLAGEVASLTRLAGKLLPLSKADLVAAKSTGNQNNDWVLFVAQYIKTHDPSPRQFLIDENIDDITIDFHGRYFHFNRFAFASQSACLYCASLEDTPSP